MSLGRPNVRGDGAKSQTIGNLFNIIACKGQPDHIKSFLVELTDISSLSLLLFLAIHLFFKRSANLYIETVLLPSYLPF